MAQPLTQLTHKDAIWQWGKDQQKAFDTLKSCVTNESILAQPNLTEQFILEVDALGYAVGTVLLQ